MVHASISLSYVCEIGANMYSVTILRASSNFGFSMFFYSIKVLKVN